MPQEDHRPGSSVRASSIGFASEGLYCLSGRENQVLQIRFSDPKSIVLYRGLRFGQTSWRGLRAAHFSCYCTEVLINNAALSDTRLCTLAHAWWGL